VTRKIQNQKMDSDLMLTISKMSSRKQTIGNKVINIWLDNIIIIIVAQSYVYVAVINDEIK
jgi:hypothetical protein